MADSPMPMISLPRRIWRWFKRIAGLFLLAVLVMAVFHRPIILWVLNRFGPDVAKSAGLTLGWQVDGSLWSNLKISKVRASGLNDEVPIKSLTVGELVLDYDLRPIRTQDYFSIAKNIILRDVEATVDLSKPSPPPAKPSEPIDFKALDDLLKKINLPGISLENITLTLLLPDGEVVLEDLDLNLPAGKPGTLHIAAVDHPALKFYPLREITAELEVATDHISIRDMKLPPRLEVSTLDAQVALADGKVAANSILRSGNGTITMNGEANISGPSPVVDLQLDLAGFNHHDATAWAGGVLPAQGTLQKFHVKVKGDVMQPHAMEVAAELHASGIKHASYVVDEAQLEARLEDGVLEMKRVFASTGGNSIEASAQARLPLAWKDVAASSAQVVWKLNAPALENIAGLPIKVTGAVSGKGI